MDILVPILIIAVLIFLNGVFVATEFSIVVAPQTRLTQLAERGNRSARQVLNVMLDPVLKNRYIATAQVGITVVSLGLGAYGEHILADWIFHALGGISEALAHTIATVASVSFLTYLHVVIGEMIPKTLALQSSEKTVLSLIRPMQIVGTLFFPVVWLLNKIGDAIVYAIGITPPEDDDRMFSADELEYIVDESFESGVIEESEHLFIENIFDLQERIVQQVMTPRTRITGISINAKESEIFNRVCETRKSRYPIYDQNLDEIVGILHVKDFARHWAHQNGASFELKRFLHDATFVPETLRLSNLLVQFRTEQLQMAIVVDEYGGTAGIVTIEDLIEEVVGEIQDEFDNEILPIEVLEENKILRVRGDLLLDELNQLYDLELEIDDIYTVGGLVMKLLGRIPAPADTVTQNGLQFRVESTERLAVQSVLIYLPDDDGKKEEQ